ncbi:FG-GAP repeat domain-containing protein [Streptomyces sp. NPDC004266]|uniref:FG-GAP repeat domain-containing protein n=1 Tax=Streptomyces sp. NPDC004266 TaxID=3364693 RepID=UPI0036D05496
MRHTPSSRRLTAAVTAVLAVTLGAASLTAPASAAPADGTGTTPGASATADGVISMPAATRIVSAGPSGFLTAAPAPDSPIGDPLYSWTSTVDGTTTALPTLGGGAVYYGGFSDSVVMRQPTGGYRVYDMSQPGASYESFSVNGTPLTHAAIGGTVVLSYYDDASRTGSLWLSRKGVDAGANRQVSGLPGDVRILRAEPTSPTTVAVHYTTRDAESVVHHLVAVVDVTTASVVERRETGNAVYSADFDANASYLAWVETWTAANGSRTATLKYAERAAEGAGPLLGSVDLGVYANTSIALLGSALVYSVPTADVATAPNPLLALNAVDVVNGTKSKLLDTATSAVRTPDGSLLVHGGTVAQGEGVYRLTVAENGGITVTLVASTGRPTALKVLRSSVPAVVDFDRTDGKATLEWQLSRQLASGTVKVRHVRTGKVVLDHAFDSYNVGSSGLVKVTWNDRGGYEHAPNGDYAVEFTATPKNGIGPAVKQTSPVKIVRAANPHDFNDNGAPDLLARDAAGVLWRDDVFHSETSAGIDLGTRTKLGAGFQAYNAIEAAGNLAGGPAGDFVARDTAGVLWSFLGKGDGTFAARTKVGPGWGAYNKIAAGSDLTGDGRPDLVAVDGAGALWLHKATGKWDAPYAARVRLASAGFNTYNQIAAVGNIAGGTAGDLLARDTAGVLWLFAGKGDGTFAPRTRVGSGWGAYKQLVGAGDINRDGIPDLVAYGTETFVYLGTGKWDAPLSTKQYGQLYYAEGGKFNALA